MTGYDYPTMLHTRRHGPSGYKVYESYREWLRDEFMFRCVYCLHRERWYGRATTFHIDHATPVDVDPNAECLYENLLYACSTCNNAKRAVTLVPNPCQVAFADCLKVHFNGEVEALNIPGEKLCEVLRMNSPANVDYRLRWIRTLTALSTYDQVLFEELMGYPSDLPDLRKAMAPGNALPEGALNCYYVQRENGCLAATY